MAEPRLPASMLPIFDLGLEGNTLADLGLNIGIHNVNLQYERQFAVESKTQGNVFVAGVTWLNIFAPAQPERPN